MTSTIRAPDLRDLLTPILPSLPAASLSSQPAPAILRLLTPILRQRVQLLTTSSNDPWLRLLTYDKTKEQRLSEVARSDRLEPHPVSGEVEVDWDYDVQTQYKRLDEETLQALVVLEEFELFFRLLYCVNDEAGGGDGWRVGEVSIPDKPSPFASFAGYPSVGEAEAAFAAKVAGETASSIPRAPSKSGQAVPRAEEQKEEYDDDDDDDDDYWARYDAEPSRTPQVKGSPAPAASHQQAPGSSGREGISDEDDAYYSQYDGVQPAMDNHDPDEAQAAHAAGLETSAPPPPLGLQHPTAAAASGQGEAESVDTNGGSWTLAPSPGARSRDEEERTAALAHPRPASVSSVSSHGSQTVRRLEAQAGRQEQSEFGVKQHVSRSIRSLFLLSRAAGIDRDEFERMVKAELDVLSMVEHDM